MRKLFFLAFFLLGGSISAFAVGVRPSTPPSSSTLEVLKLPAENRRMVVSGKEDQFYKSFVGVAFNDANPMSLRWRALIALAETHGVKATTDILKAGEDKQWFMRNAALVALSEVNPEQATKLAQKLLKDKALVVRSAAVGALEKNSSVEIRDLLWEELNQSYNFKNQQSLWIRHQIVGALAQKPRSHEVKLFAKLLSDKDTRVQLPAVRGLEKLTGLRLGQANDKPTSLIGLWKDYIQREKIEL
jgi:hypothetical protein